MRQARQPKKTGQPKLVTLTCDPGFSAFGWGIIYREQGLDTCVDAGVITTKKASKKERVLANEDSFMRVREIASALIDLVLAYKVNLLTFEAFSIPIKSSKPVLVKIGFPYAVLATLAVYDDLAVVMMTPQHVKKKICGRLNASKDDVQAVMAKKFSGHPGVEKFLNECAPSRHNHIWDALAAYVAAGDSDVMRALKIGT